ncbi:DsbA family protein [Roseixanthobacter pseudopolyaromaticivorans]|uniref:DsbA family protein n=1 Tax=Xanthobacteraceae TaxID=335928 RepID=UPI003727AD13
MQSRRCFLISTAALLAIPTTVTRVAAQQPSREEVFFDPVTPVLGNPDGDVTIVEFFDYQCPFCKSTYPELKKFVSDDGNLRLMMRDWPIFGEASRFAAEHVLALDPQAYGRAHEALMGTEGRLAESDVIEVLEDASVKGLAPAHSPEAVADTLSRNDRMAKAFGLAGTPSFAIGSKIYGGVLDRTGLAQAVLEARRKRT